MGIDAMPKWRRVMKHARRFVQTDIEILDRETVERIARIVGPSSAAAQCLKVAPQYGDNAVFFRWRDMTFVARHEDVKGWEKPHECIAPKRSR